MLFRSPNLQSAMKIYPLCTTAAKPTSIAKFDLIPRGQVPPNPSELLMSERDDEDDSLVLLAVVRVNTTFFVMFDHAGHQV